MARYWGLDGEIVTSRDLARECISPLRAQHIGFAPAGCRWVADADAYRLVDGGETRKTIERSEQPNVIARNARLAPGHPSVYKLTRTQIHLLREGRALRVQDALGEFVFGVEKRPEK